MFGAVITPFDFKGHLIFDFKGKATLTSIFKGHAPFPIKALLEHSTHFTDQSVAMTTPPPTSWGLEHTKSKRKELIKRIGWEDHFSNMG